MTVEQQLDYTSNLQLDSELNENKRAIKILANLSCLQPSAKLDYLSDVLESMTDTTHNAGFKDGYNAGSRFNN